MTHLVNMHQSPETRRLKYAIARSSGRNPSWARAMRDFRWSALAVRLGFKDKEELAAYFILPVVRAAGGE